MIRTAALSLLTLSLAAQAPGTKKADPKTPAPRAAAPAKTPAPGAGDKILAKVGDRIVRQSDMDFALEGMTPQERSRILQTPGGRERYTKQYIELFILAAKARKDGVDKAPKYDQKLQLAVDQLLANEIIRRDQDVLQAKLSMSDEEVKAYFDKNIDKFKSPEKFSARHILVPTKGTTPGARVFSEDEAKAEIAKIQAEFKKGRTWNELAKEFSSDPGSKEKGGLYENIPFGSFMGEFEAAVRKQEPGKVGDAVKTDYGYHLIQVEKIIPGETPTFEKVKDQARQRAVGERSEKVWSDYIDSIKKEIPVQMGSDLNPAAASSPSNPAATPSASKPAAKPSEAKKSVEAAK